MKNNTKRFATLIAIVFICTSAYIAYSEYKGLTPQIDVNYLGMNPEKPNQGEEVEITYEIDPKPFKMEKSKSQEIVFVLDTSSGMKSNIKELQSAVKEFIHSLSHIDTFKLGIVTYSDNGTIKTSPNLMDVSAPGKLSSIVSQIKTSGESNMGDAIRKAEHILSNGDKNAHKSIILMSNGKPTNYSINSDGSYYLNIDNTNPKVNTDKNKAKEYAIEIGKKIKPSRYDIYSVGYKNGNENSEEHTTLKEVHTAMGGIDEQLYQSDNLIEIFNSISKELEDKYTIRDANISFDIGSKVSLVESNNKDLNIEYTLQDDGWYRAEKQLFKIKVKCNASGKIDLIKDIKFTYTDINGEEVINEIPDVEVYIEVAKVPDVDLNYVGMEPQKPLYGQEVEVTYELDPHPFKLAAPPPQEIVLVLDDSGSMSNNNKIKNLKKAAKRFINQLKETENLKVGIVAYSTIGTINPTSGGKDKKVETINNAGKINSHSVKNYKSNSQPLMYDINDPLLINMIDSLGAKGGTNTGEGLRKAEYILSNGNPNANKSLILMSDGLPTFKSVKDIRNNREEYLTIDNSSPGVMGDGNENSQENIRLSAEYAKKIGNMISKKGYDVFTIGYGLGNESSTSNKTLKEIHGSMGGKVEQFYATDSNIDEIFEGIGNKLGNSYKVDNPKIDFTFSKDIEVTEMPNKTPEINYKLESDGWYRAEKQLFKIKFKCNSVGDIEAIKNMNFTYKDINGNIISKEVPELSINIEDEKVPDIDLNYIGMDPENPVLGDEVTVTYELDPQPFKIAAPPSQEIVLVLDDSGSMSNNNKITNLKKAAKKFINQLKETENLKVGIVAYSTIGTINPTSGGKDKKVETINNAGKINSHSVKNYKSNSQPLMYDINDPLLINMIDSLGAMGGTNTGEGLRKAEYILSNGNPNANKSLILMSDGLPTFKSVKDIRNNREEYLTIDDSTPGVMGDGNENSQENIRLSAEYAKKIGNMISKKGYDVFTIGYGLGNESSTSNKTLKEIHGSMGGKVEQFYATDSNIDEIFEGIGNKLGNSYKVDNPKIDFTFSEDIEVTEMPNETPEINYKLESDGWYRAPKQPIIFKFRTLKPGIIDVVKDPTLSYNKISLGDVPGETVKVTSNDVSINVKDRNILISHGLLNRKDNTLNISDNQKNVIKDMYYNVGVDIEIKENNSKLTITPPNLDIVDMKTLKIYTHDDGKVISEIEHPSISTQGNNIIIDNLNKGTYVISYHCKFNQNTEIVASLERENKIFKASIEINDNGIDINKPSLPELF